MRMNQEDSAGDTRYLRPRDARTLEHVSSVANF